MCSGQGAGAVFSGTALRHDWEVVVSSVIDFAAEQQQFDLRNGLVVYGLSLGGHLLSRACLHETRPHAYVLDPINPSLKRAMNEKLPAAFLDDMLSDSPGSSTYGSILRWMIEKKAYQALASRAQVTPRLLKSVTPIASLMLWSKQRIDLLSSLCPCFTDCPAVCRYMGWTWLTRRGCPSSCKRSRSSMSTMRTLRVSRFH